MKGKNKVLKTIKLEENSCRFFADKGFFVARTIDGESVIGEAIIEPTGEIDVEGEYKTTSKYGRQFVVSHVYYRDIKSLIAVLLNSGFLLGIREKKAVAMANTLGERCFEVLDACLAGPSQTILWNGMQKEPRKILLGINGVGPIVCEQILSSWEERRGNVAATMLALRVDLKPSQFRKAMAYFGSKFSEVILKNAYSLTNVSGISWETADRIALLEWDGKKAVAKDSVERIGAGVREVLRLKKIAGHMAFPLRDTLQEAKVLLAIDINIWEKIKDRLRNLGLIYTKTDVQMLSFSENYSVEERTAKKIAQMMKAPAYISNWQTIDPQKFTDVKLGEDHIDAIKMILSNNVSIVTGGPGTGKTTSVLNTVLNIFDALGEKYTYVQCAPTGKAAVRMTEASGRESFTLHRKFQIHLDELIGFEENILVIDEMSMTDSEVFEKVIANLSSQKVLIMIGDSDQLPPVGPGEPLKQLLQCCPSTRLTKIYRQGAGSGIVHAAHMINRGEVPQSMDNFYHVQIPADDIPSTIVRYIDRMIEKGIKFENIQVLTPINKGPLGRLALCEYLKNQYNPQPPMQRGFTENDRVIHCRNNYGLEVMNGETGEISAINYNKPADTSIWSEEKDWRLAVRYPHREVKYDEDSVLELQLAYAMTIHKTQGSEFEAVIIVFPFTAPMFYLRPLPYTGITRAKKICVVISVGKAFELYVKGKTEAIRYSLLADLVRKELAK